MNIPAAMFIEMAQDTLTRREPKMIAAELKEFNSFGTARFADTRAKLGLGELASDAAIGYLLGIETMRALLATNPAAVQAKVDI